MRKNLLQALLPIHALRERRALRMYHEQKENHALALSAREQAVLEQARLEREAEETLAQVASSSTMNAEQAQWTLHVAAQLKEDAQACERTLPELAVKVQKAEASMDEARQAHVARVRGHRKVEEAGNRVARRDERTLAAMAEQLADDDFAPMWIANQAAANLP